MIGRTIVFSYLFGGVALVALIFFMGMVATAVLRENLGFFRRTKAERKPPETITDERRRALIDGMRHRIAEKYRQQRR